MEVPSTQVEGNDIKDTTGACNLAEGDTLSSVMLASSFIQRNLQVETNQNNYKHVQTFDKDGSQMADNGSKAQLDLDNFGTEVGDCENWR